VSWVTPPVKAVGDVLYAADVNTLSGDLTLLATPPMASAYKTATQSIANVTGTNLVLDTVLMDQDPTGSAIYNSGTGVFTIRTAGAYSAEGQVQWQANGSSTGTAQAAIRKNGTANVVQSVADGQNIVESSPVVMEAQRFVVGDTLQLRCFQDSGAARTVDNQTQGTFMVLRFESL
jgi:hypothetical protein